MTIRGILWVVLLAFAGILSAGVSLFGIIAALRIDLRQDTLLCLLYSVFRSSCSCARRAVPPLCFR
jgi:hypothetical protein